MTKNGLTIIPSQLAAPADIESNISIINAPLGDFLQHVGLPTEDLLCPIDERRKVIQAIESVLKILPIAERSKATYISKFAICVTVGLFDGALAFLWDETIKALQNKVINFDLEYFYSIAKSLSSRYRGLKDPENISAIAEQGAVRAVRRFFRELCGMCDAKVADRRFCGQVFTKYCGPNIAEQDAPECDRVLGPFMLPAHP